MSESSLKGHRTCNRKTTITFVGAPFYKSQLVLCNAAIIHSLVFTAYLVLLGNIRFLSKSAAPSISPSISRSAASSETRTTAAKARTGPPFSCSFPATENVQRIRLQSEKRQKDQSNEEYDQTIHCGLHFLRKRHERTAGRLPTRVK